MRGPSFLLGAVLETLTGLPVIALSYLGTRWAGLPFVPFALFDWLARVLPGRLIAVGIDAIVQLIRLLGLGPIDTAAKRIEQLLGVLSAVAGAALPWSTASRCASTSRTATA